MADPQTVDDPCPRRGPGLRHHADVAKTGMVCTECGVVLIDPRLTRPSPVFDIVKRLQDLGYFSPAPAEPPPPTTVEQRHITGYGPTGTASGPGRGVITARQERRLLFLAWLRERGEAD